MENIVVGVFETYDQAAGVAAELERAGFSPANVQLSPDIRDAATGQDGAGTAPAGGHPEHRISHFFHSLFGGEEHDEYRGYYAEAARRGNCVLTVDADSDMQRRQAVEIIESSGALDIEERVGRWRSEGWTRYDRHAESHDAGDDSAAARAAGEGAGGLKDDGPGHLDGRPEDLPAAARQRGGAARVFTRGENPGR